MVASAQLAGAAPPPVSHAASPLGASALDAFGVLRDAEAQAYRLDDDGVRILSMRVDSSAVDALTGPGGELAGRDVRVRLWWRAGETRVVIEGARGASPATVANIENLARPLPALLIPEHPSRGLLGCTFRFVGEGGVVKAGERGIEVTDRSGRTGIRRALFAVSGEGLIVGERIERTDGRTSEFRHSYVLQGGRYLLSTTQGWMVGRRVAAEIVWGDVVAERPVPTHVLVLQGDLLTAWPEEANAVELRLSEHRINEEPPAGTFD